MCFHNWKSLFYIVSKFAIEVCFSSEKHCKVLNLDLAKTVQYSFNIHFFQQHFKSRQSYISTCQKVTESDKNPIKAAHKKILLTQKPL